MKERGIRPDTEAYSLAMTVCAMDKRIVTAIEHLKVCDVCSISMPFLSPQYAAITV